MAFEEDILNFVIKFTGKKTIDESVSSLKQFADAENLTVLKTKILASETEKLKASVSFLSDAGKIATVTFKNEEGALKLLNAKIEDSIALREKNAKSIKKERDASVAGRRVSEAKTFTKKIVTPIRLGAAAKGKLQLSTIQQLESALSAVESARKSNNFTLKEFETIQTRVATGTSIFTGREKELADTLRNLSDTQKQVTKDVTNFDKVRQVTSDKEIQRLEKEAKANSKTQAKIDSRLLKIRTSNGPERGQKVSKELFPTRVTSGDPAKIKTFANSFNNLTKAIAESNLGLEDVKRVQQSLQSGNIAFSESELKVAQTLRATDLAFKNVLISQKQNIANSKATKELNQQRGRKVAGQLFPTEISGDASKVKTFAAQFNNLSSAIAKSKLEIKDVIRIQKQLKNGNISFTGSEKKVASALRGTQVALDKVNKAQKKTGESGKKAGNSVLLSWTSVARLFAVQQIHKVIGLISSAMRESITTSSNFSVAISEIQTIAGNTTFDFQKWRDEIIKVAQVSNRDLGDVAEGVYQTLSNQIAKSAEAIEFVRKAAIFSRVSVSSLSDSVNLLSSSLNAFDSSTSRTTRDSEILFKVVELGRVRVEDLANTYGRVAVIAKEVGVSQEELGAALASLTVQGIPVTEAQTQIRNVLLKLIKPTDAMKKLLRSFGVESGEAALKTFGFVGVIKKILKATGDSTTELSKLFGRVRSIVGVLGLARGKGEAFAETLRKIKFESQETFAKAQVTTLENIGFQFTDIGNRLKILFVEDFGQKIVEAVVGLNKSLEDTGGIVGNIKAGLEPLSSLIKSIFPKGKSDDVRLSPLADSIGTIVGLTGGLAALTFTVLPVINSFGKLGDAAKEFGTKGTKALLDYKGAAKTAKKATGQLFKTLAGGITIAVVAGQIIGTLIRRNAEAAKVAAEKRFKEQDEVTKKITQKLTIAFKRRSAAILSILKKRSMATKKILAEEIADLIKQQDLNVEVIKKTNEALKESLKSLKSFNSTVNASLVDDIAKTRRRVEKLKDTIIAIKNEASKNKIEIKLKSLIEKDKVSLIEKEVKKSVKNISDEIAKVKNTQVQIFKTESLKEQTKLLNKNSESTRKINKELKTFGFFQNKLKDIQVILKLTPKEIESARTQIKKLQRQKILIEKTTAKKIAKLRTDTRPEIKAKLVSLIKFEDEKKNIKIQAVQEKIVNLQDRMRGDAESITKAQTLSVLAVEQVLKFSKELQKVEENRLKIQNKRKDKRKELNRQVSEDIQTALQSSILKDGKVIDNPEAVIKKFEIASERFKRNALELGLPAIEVGKTLVQLQEKLNALIIQANKIELDSKKERVKEEDEALKVRAEFLKLNIEKAQKGPLRFTENLKVNLQTIQTLLNVIDLSSLKDTTSASDREKEIGNKLQNSFNKLRENFAIVQNLDPTEKLNDLGKEKINALADSLDKALERLKSFNKEFSGLTTFANVKSNIGGILGSLPSAVTDIIGGGTGPLTAEEILKQFGSGLDTTAGFNLKSGPVATFNAKLKITTKLLRNLKTFDIDELVQDFQNKFGLSGEQALKELKRIIKKEKIVLPSLDEKIFVSGQKILRSILVGANRDVEDLTNKLNTLKIKQINVSDLRTSNQIKQRKKIITLIKQESKIRKKLVGKLALQFNLNKKLNRSKIESQRKDLKEILRETRINIERLKNEASKIKKERKILEEVQKTNKQIQKSKDTEGRRKGVKEITETIKVSPKEDKKLKEIGIPSEQILMFRKQSLIKQIKSVLKINKLIQKLKNQFSPFSERIKENENILKRNKSIQKQLDAAIKIKKVFDSIIKESKKTKPIIKKRQDRRTFKEDKNFVQLVAFKDKSSFNNPEGFSIQELVNLGNKNIPKAILTGFKEIKNTFGIDPRVVGGMPAEFLRKKKTPFEKLTPPEQVKFFKQAQEKEKQRIEKVKQQKLRKTLDAGIKKFDKLFGTFADANKEQARAREFLISKGIFTKQFGDRTQAQRDKRGELFKPITKFRDESSARRDKQRELIKNKGLESRFNFLKNNPGILKGALKKFLDINPQFREQITPDTVNPISKKLSLAQPATQTSLVTNNTFFNGTINLSAVDTDRLISEIQKRQNRGLLA